MQNNPANNLKDFMWQFLMDKGQKANIPALKEYLPDGHTEAEIKGKSISDNQRYKMLGNGWTVDVIAHIFRNLEALA